MASTPSVWRIRDFRLVMGAGVVTEDQLVQASAAFSAGGSIARLVGAPLGGIAIATGGLDTVVAVDAATFLTIAFAMLFLRAPTDPIPKPVTDDPHEVDESGVLAVWRMIRTRPVLVGYLVAQSLALLCDTWQQVCTAKTNGTSGLDAGELNHIRTAYQTIIAAGHHTNPPPAPTGKQGRPKRTKAANLLLRLDTHTSHVLRFATDFAVPFDNNLAERDIRMVKVHQKISGGFRSTQGAQAFLALRSYLSTATKHGVIQLEALQQFFNHNAWIPATTTGPAP